MTTQKLKSVKSEEEIEFEPDGYAYCIDNCIAGNIGYCKCDDDCACHCHRGIHHRRDLK